MRRLVLTAAIAAGMLSCSKPADRQQSTAPLPPEIESAAISRGRVIALQAFQLLSSNLLQAINTQGASNALPYCSAQAIPLTSMVAQTNGVVLRRVSHKARNPANQANAAETALIATIQGDIQAGQSPRPIALSMDSNRVTFYAPIVITNSLCLKCHGAPETEVELDTLVAIRKFYPSDAATGFKVGELRGLWRIDFARDGF